MTNLIADRIEAAAQRWNATGRAASELWTGMDFLVGYCWLFTAVGRRAGTSALTEEFIRACKAHVGSGYLSLLGLRSQCDLCGTPYKIENLSVCAECRLLHCPSCAGRKKWTCGCGGELVG
jgi:hypothetical protein